MFYELFMSYSVFHLFLGFSLFSALPCILQSLAGHLSVEELKSGLQHRGADVGLIDLVKVEAKVGEPGHVDHRVPGDCLLPPTCVLLGASVYQRFTPTVFCCVRSVLSSKSDLVSIHVSSGLQVHIVEDRIRITCSMYFSSVSLSLLSW